MKVNALGTIPFFEDLKTGTTMVSPRPATPLHSGTGYKERCIVHPRGKQEPLTSNLMLHLDPHSHHSQTESCAIPQYIAATRGPTDLAVGVAEADYGDYLNWIAHADATLTFPQTVVLRYTLQEPGRADDAARDYGRWFIARLRRLDAALADGRQFLCSDRLTIADICVTYALFLGTTLSVDGVALSTRYKPQTSAYLERMRSRRGWAEAEIAENASFENFDANALPSIANL
jgi:glutathione S-transferase